MGQQTSVETSPRPSEATDDQSEQRDPQGLPQDRHNHPEIPIVTKTKPVHALFLTPNFVIEIGCILLKYSSSRAENETKGKSGSLEYDIVMTSSHASEEKIIPIFPKGKKNTGESLSDAALRVAYEETGYRCALLPLPKQAFGVYENSASSDNPPQFKDKSSSSDKSSGANGDSVTTMSTEPFAMSLDVTKYGKQQSVYWFAAIAMYDESATGSKSHSASKPERLAVPLATVGSSEYYIPEEIKQLLELLQSLVPKSEAQKPMPEDLTPSSCSTCGQKLSEKKSLMRPKSKKRRVL